MNAKETIELGVTIAMVWLATEALARLVGFRSMPEMLGVGINAAIRNYRENRRIFRQRKRLEKLRRKK